MIVLRHKTANLFCARRVEIEYRIHKVDFVNLLI